MKQIARNLTDSLDGFLAGKRFLIVDRDPLYTAAFRRLLCDQGVDVLRIPPRSPNLNAYAERIVRTVRSECLDHIIPLSEAHLRRVLREFLAHYHLERNHQGLDNAPIEPRAGPMNDNGSVLRKQRLGASSTSTTAVRPRDPSFGTLRPRCGLRIEFWHHTG